MKKTLIILLLVVPFISSSIMAEKPESVLFKKLKEQIALNKTKEARKKNYLIHIDLDGNSVSPASLGLGVEWVEENIEGLVPLKQEYLDLLNIYNEKGSKDLNGEKAQHYIMVVDVAPSIFSRIIEYPGYSYTNYFKIPDNDITYNDILDEERENAINAFNVKFEKESIQIKDPEGHLYVTLFLVNRKINNSKLESLEFWQLDTYAKSDLPFHNRIVEVLNPKLEAQVKNGFVYLGNSILSFIQTFHGETPEVSNCNQVESLGFQSNWGTNFYTQFCNPEISDAYLHDAVYRSAMFLDYLHIYFGTVTPETQAYLGASFLQDWSDLLTNFINDYSATGLNQTYPIWLKLNFETLYIDHKDLGYILSAYDHLYLGIFFKWESFTGEQYNSILKDDFEIVKSNVQEFITFRQSIFSLVMNTVGYLSNAETLTDRLYNAVVDAYSSDLFTNDDRDELKLLIINNPDVLWNFYLNPNGPGIPLIGFKATALAEAIGEFLKISEETLNLDNAENPEESSEIISKRQIVTGFKKTFMGATGGNEDFDIVQDIVLTPSDDYYEIAFRVEIAKNFIHTIEYTGNSSHYVWRPVPGDPAVFSLEGDEAPGFFEIIINYNIKNPNYFIECTDCKKHMTAEYAFITATRLREKATDRNIENAILAIEIASLPFSILELAAAKGAYRIFRGIVLATELEGVFISAVGEGSFEEGCKRLFGEDLGVQLAPYFNAFNAFVAIPDAFDGAAALLKKSFTKDELVKAAVAADYWKRNPGIETEKLDEIKSIRTQIENNFGINNVGDAKILINAGVDELYGLTDVIPELKENEKLKKLFNQYQSNKGIVPLGEQAGIMQTSGFLEGLSVADQHRLNEILEGTIADEIIAIFNESSDITQNSKQLEALKKFVQSDVCLN